MDHCTTISHALSAVSPDKLATMFTTALTLAAGFGAALVTLRVGRGTQIVAAREKGPVLVLDGISVTSNGSHVLFEAVNAGVSAARWLSIRFEGSDRLVESITVPVLLPQERKAMRFGTGASRGSTPITCRIDVSWTTLEDTRLFDRRKVVLDPRGIAAARQTPVGGGLLAAMARAVGW